jgi:hypothetical protein
MERRGLYAFSTNLSKKHGVFNTLRVKAEKKTDWLKINPKKQKKKD